MNILLLLRVGPGSRLNLRKEKRPEGPTIFSDTRAEFQQSKCVRAEF